MKVSPIADSSDEYELIALPETFHEFVDWLLFQQPNEDRVLWISDTVYCCRRRSCRPERFSIDPQKDDDDAASLLLHVELKRRQDHELTTCDNKHEFWLHYGGFDWNHQQYTHSRRMDTFWKLSMDNFYDSIQLRSEVAYSQCPLSPVQLGRLLVQHNSYQVKYRFCALDFTAAQGVVLASVGRGTCLQFCFCRFLDGGSAFVEALLLLPSADDNEEEEELSFENKRGPCQITISGANSARGLLDEDSWIDFCESISYDDLESLEIVHSTLPSEDCYRSFESAEIQHLIIRDGDTLLEFLDTLLKCVQTNGEGFKKLSFPLFFARMTAEIIPKLVTFMGALKMNDHMELLEIFCKQRGVDAVLRSLAEALARNQGLRHLYLRDVHILNSSILDSLLQSLLFHPTLETLRIEVSAAQVWHGGSENLMEQRLSPDRRENVQKTRCNHIRSLLVLNRKIGEISFLSDNLYDRSKWERQVTPRLLCNRYRDKLQRLHQEKAEFRAGLLANAMEKLSSSSISSPQHACLAWTLLSQNQDVLCLGGGFTA